MLTLLVKDFKLLFHSEKKLSNRIISLLISILFIGSFVAIEVFLFTTILKKIGTFHQAQNAFTSLFLFIISLLLIVSNLLNANKLFFNEKDIEQLSTRPIGNTDIILSKLFFMFLTHYFTSLIFTYPIFVSYGIIGAKTIKFSDKYGIKSATLNGKKISSGKVVSKNGSYKLVVTDKAGNKSIIKFKITSK